MSAQPRSTPRHCVSGDMPAASVCCWVEKLRSRFILLWERFYSAHFDFRQLDHDRIEILHEAFALLRRQRH